MKTNPAYRDSWINPRLKIAALWTTMLFVFVYVDLFSLYRDDVRADIEAGELAGFTIGQVFLFFTTFYIAIPSLMLAMTLLLPVRAVRRANLVIAALYIPTILGAAAGEWGYYVFGSAIETVLLLGIIVSAWKWPRIPAGDTVARGPGDALPAVPPAELQERLAT